jgi:CRP/FNR family cyclic AMP-dependent transcriptional regulator
MDFAATMVSPDRELMIELRSTMWAQTLQAQELARVEAEISERAVPAGGYVCRKGEPVNHWIGIIDGPRQSRHGVAFGQGSHPDWRALGRVVRRRLVHSGILLAPDARVARCLAWLFNPFLYPGIGQKLQVSQEEIGYLSGISRQRVNQALQTLEKEGLLRVEYGGVTILDLDRLMHR